MSKHRSFSVAVAFAVLAVAGVAPAHADLVGVGDIVNVSTSLPGAAPRFDVSRAPSYDGGPFRVANATSGDVWVSFCIEVTETIKNGDPYAVSAVGRTTSSGRPLTSAAEWLYEQFRLGGSFAGFQFEGAPFDALTGQHTRILQEAIWLAMGYDLSGRSVAGGAQDLADHALGRSTLGLVRIVQLVTIAGQLPRQDQLAIVPVPEPGTLALVGFGLLAAGAVLRRRVPGAR